MTEDLQDFLEEELDKIDKLKGEIEARKAGETKEQEVDIDENPVQQYKNLFLLENPYLNNGEEKEYSREEKAIAFLNLHFNAEQLNDALESDPERDVTGKEVPSDDKFLHLFQRIYKHSFLLIRYFLLHFADDRKKIGEELRAHLDNSTQKDQDKVQELHSYCENLLNKLLQHIEAANSELSSCGGRNITSPTNSTANSAATRSINTPNEFGSSSEASETEAEGESDLNQSQTSNSGLSIPKLKNSITKMFKQCTKKLQNLKATSTEMQKRLILCDEQINACMSTALQESVASGKCSKWKSRSEKAENSLKSMRALTLCQVALSFADLKTNIDDRPQQNKENVLKAAESMRSVLSELTGEPVSSIKPLPLSISSLGIVPLELIDHFKGMIPSLFKSQKSMQLHSQLSEIVDYLRNSSQNVQPLNFQVFFLLETFSRTLRYPLAGNTNSPSCLHFIYNH